MSIDRSIHARLLAALLLFSPPCVFAQGAKPAGGNAGKVTVTVEAKDIGSVAVNRGIGKAPNEAATTDATPITPQGAFRTLMNSAAGMLCQALRLLPNLAIALLVLGLRQTDGQLVVVPNSTVYSNAVRVATNRPLRRASLTCGVAYGEDVGKSREVIREAVKKCPGVSADYEIDVFAMEFADSSINFEVRWWAGSRPVEQKRSRDQVVESIKRALDAAGIEIPFPYRTLTFKSSDPLTLVKPARDAAEPAPEKPAQ